MKLSELVKLLNKAKREHGDIQVSFDGFTVAPEEAVDEFESIFPVHLIGVKKVGHDDRVRRTKEFVLGYEGSESVFDLADERNES